MELLGEEKNDGSILYGALEKASGGILLIDEVTEIPLSIQSKILRILIDQKFRRVNGNHDIKVDVRIICTNSKDISQEIMNGNFREDLYHRLNVFNISIDPLNKRIDDIPLLVDYFLKHMCNNFKGYALPADLKTTEELASMVIGSKCTKMHPKLCQSRGAPKMLPRPPRCSQDASKADFGTQNCSKIVRKRSQNELT